LVHFGGTRGFSFGFDTANFKPNKRSKKLGTPRPIDGFIALIWNGNCSLIGGIPADKYGSQNALPCSRLYI
jgi:hypothetical protein